MRLQLDRSAGITLLEIIIALLIMSSVMIPIASLMGVGGNATSKDARRIAAIQTLDKTMRQILQEDFELIPMGNGQLNSFGGVVLGNIVTSTGSYTVILDSQYVSPVTFAYQNIKVNLPTFKTDDPESDDFMPVENLVLTDCIKFVRVIVRWNEQQNIPVEVSAVSYRADFVRRNG